MKIKKTSTKWSFIAHLTVKNYGLCKNIFFIDIKNYKTCFGFSIKWNNYSNNTISNYSNRNYCKIMASFVS